MKVIISIFFIISVCLSGISQQETTPDELFSEGQYFFQKEDYKEALFFFKQLCEKFPANSNFNFKAGECYLNIPGQEYLAVPFFEKATKNIVPKKEYKQRDFQERSAPLHAMFYLGNAYRMAGQLDDALKSYNKFIDSPYFYGNYNISVVEEEIKSCERAKIIQDSPVKNNRAKLDSLINTEYSEFNAVKSGDGQTLVFVRGLKFYDAVFMAKKSGTGWSDPININQDIVSDGDYYPTGLNSDGTMMLLVREVDNNSDIYISYFKDSRWTKAEKLSGKINTLEMETFASFDPSDNSIYFVSTGNGGKGGKDIFISNRADDGSWGKPKNIGKVINSELDEESPVICNNGKTLFFSSKSHYNMGGYDIFYSNLEGKKWSIPRNIGYPISTTRDDLFYITDNTCLSALISLVEPETGLADIIEVQITESLAIP